MATYKKCRPYADYIVFGLVMSLAPLFVEMGVLRFAYLTIIASVIIYSIAALGLNILLGYAGLVSLGTAGFMGVGAYLAAIFTVDFGMGFFASFVLTIVITSLLGVVVGLVSLRIEGFFLAIATLAIAEVLRQGFIEFVQFTNAFGGRSADYPHIFGHTLSRNGTFWLLVAFLVLFMIISHNIQNSYIGRALSAMRGSEAAAAAMGVNIFKYRLVAFAIATAYAGASGVLYMHFIRFTFPNTWVLTLSLTLFAAVIIGGTRSIAGVVLGSFIVFGMPDLILSNLPVIGGIGGMAFVFTGVLIIVIMLFYPAGLINIRHSIKKLFVKRGGRL